MPKTSRSSNLRMRRVAIAPAEMDLAARIVALEQLISQDPGGRQIEHLVQADHLRQAAISLLAAKAVILVSGFYIPKGRAGETDGPPGVKALGQALTRLGVRVTYLTDERNEPLFQALKLTPLTIYRREPISMFSQTLLAHPALTHLVAIERLGRARDGRYYNMRGEDVSAYTAPLDELFLQAQWWGKTTIGIGDGGNEIGMGLIWSQVVEHVPLGERIASSIATDYLIVAGVSNWGAYGLAGALSLLSEQNLLPSLSETAEAIRRVAKAGGVDGVSGQNVATVDGLSSNEHTSLMREIHRLAQSNDR